MLYIDTCMHACRHTDIQTYKRTDVQTYRQTYRQTYTHTRIHTCIHTLHYLTWRYPIFVTIHIDSQLFIWMRLHHLVILRKLEPFFANPVPSAGMLESSRRVSFGDLCWKGKTDASCSRDTAETPRLLWSFLNNSWKGCGKDGCFQRGRTSWKKVKTPSWNFALSDSPLMSSHILWCSKRIAVEQLGFRPTHPNHVLTHPNHPSLQSIGCSLSW